MNALVLGLRSLDPQTFEHLVTALLKTRYPGKDIKHISGSSGDQGIDVISGDLDDAPTIWQCKAFRGGVGSSQKTQIKESLNRALSSFNPSKWVLCLNVDMDVRALRWWQRLAISHAADTELQLWQGADIIQQLIYYDSVREHFFPNVAINVPVLREERAGTNSLTNHDLSTFNSQNVASQIARLEKLDPRFSYAITHTRNRPLSMSGFSDSLMTAENGTSKIEVFARDHQALKSSPPQLQLQLQGTGVEKFQKFQRTGVATEFSPNEVLSFSSDFDFLLPSVASSVALQMRTAPLEPVPMKLTFGKGRSSVVYEYLLFRRVQQGSDETTLQVETSLPFDLTLVLRKDGTGAVNFKDRSIGHDVNDALRMVRAITSALQAGQIECLDLSRGVRPVRARIRASVPEWIKDFKRFLELTCEVSKNYHVPLILPSIVSHEDERALLLLQQLQKGFWTTIEPITMTMSKSVHTGIEPKRRLGVRVTVPELPREIVVFGKRVKTGAIECEIPLATVREYDQLREFMLASPLGTDLDLTLDCMGEVFLKRILSE